MAEDGGFARDGNPLLQVPDIYRSTRWPRVKSFNSNLFLNLVLYLSHVPKLQVHAASRRVGLGQHWLRSLGSGWTSAIIIFTVTMNTLVLVVGFKDVIVNAAHDKELLRRTVGATTLLGTRDP